MKVERILLIILFLGVLFLGFKSCKLEKDLDNANATIATTKLQTQTLTDSLSNKSGQIVKLQEAVVFEKEAGQKALNQFSDSVFNLMRKDRKKYENTIAFYQNYIKTHLPDTIYIPYDDTLYAEIPSVYDKDSIIAQYLKNSIPVPRTFTLNDKFFQINGTVKRSGVDINSLNLPDTLSGRFVTKKNGWFRADKIEYQVTNTNPYIKINNSKSAVYTPPKKNLWKKLGEWGVILGLGIILGDQLE